MSEAGKLLVHNTFTPGKVPFTAKDPSSNVITWYSCGPTVYDSSHMGHARTYLTIDILQRILEDYFGFQVFSVMNVTDIDDKIILKARRGHLVSKFITDHTGKPLDEATLADVRAAWEAQIKRVAEKQNDISAKLSSGEIKEGEAASLRSLAERDETRAKEALKNVSTAKTIEDIMSQEGAKDALGLYLDARDGASVENMVEVCKKHAAKYEAEFFEDMKMLGCREPQALTRVTEYVDKIIAFIAKIVENGFAYESNGSVYFDTQKFASHPDHTYGRLKANAVSVGQTANPAAASAAAENDGELGSQVSASEKRHSADFALWKRSKAGEPFWPSVWGPGRPGWHIECSCMASDVIGSELDVHFGGQDLRFPHHENELAQSEAYWGCKQWVRYFLHAGHLDIDGLKMSKSLKNFITIREAFARGYTPRQLRLMVLLSFWDRGMSFSAASVDHARTAETSFVSFFRTLRSVLRSLPPASPAFWTERETALNTALRTAQQAVHSALCDNFDTPAATGALLELVRRTQEYLRACEAASDVVRGQLLSRVGRYVSRILGVFGLTEGADGADFALTAEGSGSGAAKEEALAPVLDAVANFRKQVRERARETKDTEMLRMCDKLRDDTLPPLGVMLEDDAVVPWKLSSPEEAVRAVKEKKTAARTAALRKLEGRKRAAEQEIAQWTAFAAEPEDQVFPESEYTRLPKAADGSFVIPTHDAQGNDLGKGRAKKLAKQYEAAKKGHEKYLAQVKQDPQFLDKLKEKLASLTKEMETLLAEDDE